MSSPLPHLPNNPLGDLPENPLGAPPRPPVIGKREPLRLPEFIRQRRAGPRSTSSPLPTLRRISGANRPKPEAQPIPIRRKVKATAPQAPVIVTPRPRPTPPAAPAAKQTPPPPPPPPAAQRPNVPGRMAQPPITPQPGTRHSLHQRLERQRRGAEAYMAMHDEGTNPLADALRHHVPPEPGQKSGAGMTPEQRAKLREQAAQMRAALNNEGPNEMEGPMRHLGEH